MQKVTPCLWFEGNAEEAVNFYLSVFKNSRITALTHYSDVGPGPEGSVLTISFQLDGADMMALNAGPYEPFTHAISFVVDCRDQEEVDWYWDRLSAGGQQEPCGWLKDRFGVSWQIVPSILDQWMTDPDPHKVRRVTEAMLKMVRLDIAALQRAFDGV